MSSEEEKEVRLTYGELCRELVTQNIARMERHLQLPNLHDIGLIVKRPIQDSVKQHLRAHNLPFKDYTEPTDAECLWLVSVSIGRLYILKNLDPQAVCFQPPDILLD